MMGWGWISKLLHHKISKRIYWQNSEHGGFAAYMGFIKENRLGVVVLSNSANRVDDIGSKILAYLESLP